MAVNEDPYMESLDQIDSSLEAAYNVNIQSNRERQYYLN
jgi:hypothetical protein